MKWTQAFDDSLRRHLPLHTEPVEENQPLADLGLDSLATVALVLDLEDSLGISMPDDLLTAQTFETAGSLWAVISSLVAHPTA
jgi:acyl carrier protein